MLTTIKPVVEKTLTPVARLLRNVPPNVLTLLGLVFPVLFFVLLLNELYALALVSILLNAADMLDGIVARSQNKVTAFGGFLDSTVDRFADFTILAAFAFAEIVSWEIIAPLLLVSYLISYIRSRTELAAKGNLVAAVGIVERAERFVAIFIGLLLYAIWPEATLAGLNLAAWVFMLLLIFSAITVGQRVLFAYRKL
jgi:archaetidylinositol phosphate synthase